MRLKIWLFLICLLCMPFSFAAAPCDVTLHTDGTLAITSFDYGVWKNITVTADQSYVSLLTLLPTTTYEMYKCTNETLYNGTTLTLAWPYMKNTTIVVTNSTNATQQLKRSPGNYSTNGIAGTIRWFVDNSVWINSTVQICYNKTFDSSVNLVTYTGKYTTDGRTGYGVRAAIESLSNDLNGTAWTATYSYDSRNCIARDNCRTTKPIIFAGFGLLAILIIVTAAFLIIGVFKGDGAADMILPAVVGLIGFSIILMIGYIVVSRVALPVC